jgi:two-component system NtrC family response regulator
MIHLPPLRERDGDVIVLARTFLERYTDENRKKIKGFNSEAIMAIEQYAWPGNVRELENRIKRAVIMAEGTKITPADLEMGVTSRKYESMSLKEARENLEKELLFKALSRNDGNMTKASAELGISRPTLYDLMEKFGIPKE